MSDDFDRRLARRLRDYEGSIPDEGLDPWASRPRTLGWWAGVATGATAVVTAGVLGFVLLARPAGLPLGASSATPFASASVGPLPSGTAGATPTPSPSEPTATPIEAPSASPPPSGSPVGGLIWQEAAMFSDAEGPSMVTEVTSSGTGLVAVGVQYEHALPNVGPTPPHEGRIWFSPDGRSWEDVTPPDEFANVQLHAVVSLRNGSVAAWGMTHEERDGFLEQTGTEAWESSDGRTWTPMATNLPDGARVGGVAQGNRGYLTHVATTGPDAGSELWFSTDARSWEQVHSLPSDWVEYDAGEEGFVVAGVVLSGEGADTTYDPYALASGDGREWLEATGPPPTTVGVAAVRGDWVAATYSFGGEQLPDLATSWFSANGLEWTEHGTAALNAWPIEGGSCHEYPSGLNPAGEWLVLASTLSYPCSEGGYVVFGTQRISTDGATWEDLPLPAGTPGMTRSGSVVTSAATREGALVLVGESSGRAAFWIGEAP